MSATDVRGLHKTAEALRKRDGMTDTPPSAAEIMRRVLADGRRLERQAVYIVPAQIKALNDAGYEIRESGTLYAGCLKATSDRDILTVTHREGHASWSIEVFFDGRDIMCRTGAMLKDTGS